MRSLSTSLSEKLIEEYNNLFSEDEPVLSDTKNKTLDLDLNSQEDAFLAMVLGILYAFPTLPKYADVAIVEYKNRNLNFLDTRRLSRIYKTILNEPYKERLKKAKTVDSALFNHIYENYRRVPTIMSEAILRAGYFVENELGGDLRDLYKSCNFQGDLVLDKLKTWRVRLAIKGFWLCREMRIQKVWASPDGRLIDGRYCCVIDIQVKRAMENLGIYRGDNNLLKNSEAVWQLFGEYYDLPLLWLARNFCSKNKCDRCPVSWCCVKHN